MVGVGALANVTDRLLSRIHHGYLNRARVHPPNGGGRPKGGLVIVRVLLLALVPESRMVPGLDGIPQTQQHPDGVGGFVTRVLLCLWDAGQSAGAAAGGHFGIPAAGPRRRYAGPRSVCSDQPDEHLTNRVMSRSQLSCEASMVRGVVPNTPAQTAEITASPAQQSPPPAA